MKITRQDAHAAINSLSVAYPSTAPSQPDIVSVVWAEALGGITPKELHEAVKAQLRTDDKFFPAPGRIRTLALLHRAGGGRARELPEDEDGERYRPEPGELRKLWQSAMK